MSEAAGIPTVHATAILLGDFGLLLRGASGAGKSSLALALLDHFSAQGRFAALVADDRVVLEARNGRLVARAPARLSGLIEARGLGILHVPAEPAAVLRLVIDLVPLAQVSRLPRVAEQTTSLLGVILPRLATCSGPAAIPLICRAIQGFSQARELRLDTCVCTATSRG